MKYPLLLFVTVLVTACQSDDNDATPSGPLLHSATWYLQDQQGEFTPGEKRVYEYASGKIKTTRQYMYDVVEEKYTLFSTTTFTFQNDRLTSIHEDVEGSDLNVTTEYTYTNGKISLIEIDDELSGVDTNILIDYVDDETVEAFYSHSNGRSFTYQFSTTDSNIVYEETVNDSNEKSSEVTHEYDDGINPFSLLGYVDPLFAYYSKSNKTKTESEYFGDEHPSNVPVSYEYIYNSDNLPTQQITTYKTYPDNGSSGQVKIVYEYE